MRIAETLTTWKEVEKYSRIVTREEIAKNDFNISPSRYIHTGAGEEYRPIAEIVEELEALEEEARITDRKFKGILARLVASEMDGLTSTTTAETSARVGRKHPLGDMATLSLSLVLRITASPILMKSVRGSRRLMFDNGEIESDRSKIPFYCKGHT